MREVGVFCGTFNPIHHGHLMLAEFARDQFKLEKIIIVTSANPPHRRDDLLDAETRHELVEAACHDNPYFETSRIELDRHGPSYTVDTVRQIQEQEGPDCRLSLLVGQDNLSALRTWHEAEELFTLVRILVATRHHFVTREELIEELPSYASFEIIDFMQFGVSSSMVRARLRSEKTIRYLVPEPVHQIIERKELFLHSQTASPEKACDRSGIPDEITVDFIKEWVRPRNSEKRFRHIEGVVAVARRLALRTGCDPFLAEMGGWLHDACKETKDSKLVEMAKELHVPFGPIERAHGHLLHGPVAAAIAEKDLNITNRELLAAVAEHTLGNVPMSLLSEILFLADCLEESRSPEYTTPIWEALDIDGEINIPKAIIVASDLGFKHLMDSGRPIHPRTVDVRNHYLAKLKARRSTARSS